ncbi:DUF1016 family protein [Bacteroides ovatus]|uniref:DUF1016 family protein n=1 Tax=Bacteroides ovatus TaxID=28116 RepID=A0A413EWT1_BACOV|nr:DUF1016 family protein [Bacteroides sp. AF32-8BH]RGN65855.1 DUF1016 family protein [Bacteroides sp. OM05-10AA]RGQ68095.1 DUF1016 family protein [Bacteroides sp. AF27-33]RGX12357.1 DUF1016 family protein [Bacteroides ovatus]RGX28085.1 DUF1016 family protein [Bacteroides ovatus]
MRRVGCCFIYYSRKSIFLPEGTKCSNVDCRLTVFRDKGDKQLADKQVTELATKDRTPLIKGFSVRNCQVIVQFYNEYSQQLTNTQQPVLHLQLVFMTLSVKQLSWSHNVILMQKAKDLKARYWYMIQCLKTVGTYLLTASPLSSSISAIP